VLENAKGENIEQKWANLLKEWEPYGSGKPIPTPLRNHQMMADFRAGGAPFFLRTDTALQRMYQEVANDPKKMREIEADAWEDFLDMTMSQALIWASDNIDPAKTPSEIVLTEPYLMGSHASGTGAWVSGPEDAAPKGYFWGYNRMTTIKGLFAAGDGVGGSAHKFSSGSHVEGRLAGKAAVAYIMDSGVAPSVAQDQVEAIKAELWKPFENYEKGRGASTTEEINPNYLFPKMALHRLQKIMDEYAAGQGSQYITTEAMLNKGLERMKLFKDDLGKLAARDLHDLLRCWEVWDRTWCAEAHMRHMLFRQETRWPGYYYRADYPTLDDANWKVFVNSRYDAAKGEWQLEKTPFLTNIA